MYLYLYMYSKCGIYCTCACTCTCIYKNVLSFHSRCCQIGNGTVFCEARKSGEGEVNSIMQSQLSHDHCLFNPGWLPVFHTCSSLKIFPSKSKSLWGHMSCTVHVYMYCTPPTGWRSTGVWSWTITVWVLWWAWLFWS